MAASADSIRLTYGRGLGRVRALDGVSLAIPAGQLAVVMGAPGSGKTALLRVLAGVERVDGGVVRVGGRELAGSGDRPGTGPGPRSRLFADLEALTKELAGSPGQSPRASAPGALELALIDGPALGLGIEERLQVARKLRACVDTAGVAMLAATHDPIVATGADRIVVLSSGSVAIDIERPNHGELLELISEISRDSGRG